MWLPKKERTLIRYYYNEISKINDVEMRKIFTLEDLAKTIEKKERPQSQKTLIEDYSEVEVLNTLLSKRGLLAWEEYTTGGDVKLAISLRGDNDPNLNKDLKYQIALTIAGYDLGRKHSFWWSRSGLWFAEYKDHWFWLILSFLGGIIGALIVNWLSK
jgi:hypothetical protein